MNIPSAEEINLELGRILESKYFRHSGLLSRFLRFVVEKSLEGKANEIKEYTVGTEVLDRPKGFNPQQDASVRIHAVRLRKMVSAWYSDEGKQSTVRIILEKGRYQPQFLYTPGEEKLNGHHKSPKTTKDGKITDVLGVLPFDCQIENGVSGDVVMNGFCGQLSDAISLFEDIEVIPWFYINQYLAEGGIMSKIGQVFHASYLISGRLQISATDIYVSLYLSEPDDPTPIWSQLFYQPLESHSYLEIIRDISEKIISMLVGYSGFIHVHRYGVLDFNSLPTNQTSLAVFWFYHFITRNSPDVFREAVRQLSIAVEDDPTCAMSWAILGHLQTSGLIFGYELGEDQLEKAAESIKKALDLNPESQHGLFAMGLYKLLVGEPKAASEYFDKCYEVNPNSGYIRAALALGYSLIGNYKRSQVHLKRAFKSNPVPIWWFSLPDFNASISIGNYKKAWFATPKFNAAAGILQNIFEIIALYHLGEKDKFEQLTRVYVEKFPDGLSHVHMILDRLLYDKKVKERCLQALDAAIEVVAVVEQGKLE